jgi:hypothetical protein
MLLDQTNLDCWQQGKEFKIERSWSCIHKQIQPVKSLASAANPPSLEIDSNQHNNHLDAACNLINYEKSKQI